VPILEALAAAHPDDAPVTFNLAYVLDRLLRVREAKGWYERTLALDADNLNANLCLVWLQAIAADPELRDPAAAERRLLDVLQRDRGRHAAVLQAVREFGLRTGRIERVLDAPAQLAADGSLTEQQRATLAHTRSYLQNGAPPEGR
jgi:tetratricopeptide (TPR) repeat protein